MKGQPRTNDLEHMKKVSERSSRINVGDVKLLQAGRRYLIAKIPRKTIGFSPQLVWCPTPSRCHRTKPYPTPKSIRLGTRFDEENGANFTPPPFAVVVQNKERKSLIGVRADRGWHLYNFAEFITTNTGVEVHIDFEGHTSLKEVKEHIRVFVLPATNGESSMNLLSRGMKLLYPSAFKKRSVKTPSWWKRPIYNGYGDQVAISLEMEGPGQERRSMAYCIQGLYERWIQRLEEAGVPIGIIIIDAGWSSGGIWRPNPIQWPDLRNFIDRQHKKGRHVLLWIGTWLCGGLPDSWCIRAGKVKLVADPTNARYRTFLREQVHRLISGGRNCFDADGFEIDQLSYTPTERESCAVEHFGRSFLLEDTHPRLQTNGTKWGCELLYQLQKDINCAAKSAKTDALITSSTVHPYFYNTFDMVRLHDTGVVDTDIFTAMKARADLAKAVLPNTLIDTDNWVHIYYQKWFNYTMESYRLGVPCIMYAERFVHSWKSKPMTLRIPMKDLQKIGRNWSKNVF